MEFLLVVIPLFVAIDPVGTLPTLVGLTADLDRRQLNRVVLQSVLTATAVSVAFMSFGQPLLQTLGITVGDFLIAGGALLFLFSLKDLLSSDKPPVGGGGESLGAVPIGVPLIAGPGLLTTTLVLSSQFGYLLTLAGLVTNLALTGGLFWASRGISRVLGQTGSRTIGKIANLILAAIAVMFMRKGLIMALTDLKLIP